MSDHEHQPEEAAPATGHHEQINAFGTPTWTVIHIREGEQLPPRRADLSDAVFDGSAADSWQCWATACSHSGRWLRLARTGRRMSVVVQTFAILCSTAGAVCLSEGRVLTGRSRHGSAAAIAADGATGSAGGAARSGRNE